VIKISKLINLEKEYKNMRLTKIENIDDFIEMNRKLFNDIERKKNNVERVMKLKTKNNPDNIDIGCYNVYLKLVDFQIKILKNLAIPIIRVKPKEEQQEEVREWLKKLGVGTGIRRREPISTEARNEVLNRMDSNQTISAEIKKETI